MCGITGFWSAPTARDDLIGALEPMLQAIQHRGPDDSGMWLDQTAGICLGHRRLSILDLSPEGHQPMLSASGTYVMVFNGEVYNFEELCRQLPGFVWRGHSDTEVMLAAIEAWGLMAAVKRFVGMFAFALWDRKERQLHLVRDRLGIKPLYYGWSGGALLFGSELKALRRYQQWDSEIDPGAVAGYLRHNYIPAPHTIYRGIRKLHPGSIASFSDFRSRSVEIEKYWSATEIAGAGCRAVFGGRHEETIEQLERLLRDAVRLHMISDVPVGAFLSGGIDSSLVVALMQAQSTRPVRTFSIGFLEPEYNEADHAARVARHLGTEHTELYVTPREAQETVPEIAGLYDEPFADSSQLPTALISRLARQHVTVSLSGDGGDELFAGYNRYQRALKIWRKFLMFPGLLRTAMGTALGAVQPSTLNSLVRPLASLLPASEGHSSLSNKVSKLGRLLAMEDFGAFYRQLVSNFPEPAKLVPGAVEASTHFNCADGWHGLPDLLSQMQCLDIITYLPDDILVKVDRATMAVSLEARVPLLDHRVVEFASRLPRALRVRNGQGKWVLRQVLYRYVPRALVDRPKMGFAIPVGQWLRGPLRDWAEDLLAPSRLRSDSILNVEGVRCFWKEHLAGTHDWEVQVWSFLMLQAWCRSVAHEDRSTMGPLSISTQAKSAH